MEPGTPTEHIDLRSEARRELKPLLLRVYPLVVVVMLLLLAAGAAAGLERWQLFVDPGEEQESVLIGAFSNVGVLLWWSTVTVTALTWYLARRDPMASEFSRMCGCAALLTAFFALDDLFLLHDYVFPEWLHIPEGAILAATVAMAGFFLFHFRKIFLKTRNRMALGVALLFLCGSLLVDAAPIDLRGQGTIEDSLKFVGIVTWLYYFASVCIDHLRSGRVEAPNRVLYLDSPEPARRRPDVRS